MHQISELTKEARTLLQFTPLQYMLDTVTENPKLAQVYLNTEKHPSSCALLFGHYLFVGGTRDDAFLTEFISVLTPELRQAMECMIVFYETEHIADFFRKYFEKVYNNARQLYVQTPTLQKTFNLPAHILPIDERLLASGLENIKMITHEVMDTATYHSMDDFCRRGIGYTLVCGNKICGFCTSEYPSIHALAIGIEVTADYRKQGIASEMTRAFLQRAAPRDLRVYWECWASNEASARTAMACGFTKVADYPVLFIPLD